MALLIPLGWPTGPALAGAAQVPHEGQPACRRQEPPIQDAFSHRGVLSTRLSSRLEVPGDVDGGAAAG